MLSPVLMRVMGKNSCPQFYSRNYNLWVDAVKIVFLFGVVVGDVGFCGYFGCFSGCFFGLGAFLFVYLVVGGEVFSPQLCWFGCLWLWVNVEFAFFWWVLNCALFQPSVFYFGSQRFVHLSDHDRLAQVGATLIVNKALQFQFPMTLKLSAIYSHICLNIFDCLLNKQRFIWKVVKMRLKPFLAILMLVLLTSMIITDVHVKTERENNGGEAGSEEGGLHCALGGLGLLMDLQLWLLGF